MLSQLSKEEMIGIILKQFLFECILKGVDLNPAIPFMMILW